MSKDATAFHFLKRLFYKVRDLFSSEKRDNQENNRAFQEHDRAFLLEIYAHCLADVVKYNKLVLEQGVEEASAYIYRRFDREAQYVLKKFKKYLNSSLVLTTVEISKFANLTSYDERYKFAEALVALAKTCEGFSNSGISISMNNYLSKLMLFWGLKKNHCYTLLRNYRTRKDRESENSERTSGSENQDKSNEKTENDRRRGALTKTHLTYIYCLACVVKADGVVTMEERRKVEDFLTSKFTNDVFINTLMPAFNNFLDRRKPIVPKVHYDFLTSTSIHERYAFAEMLFSLAMTNDNYPTKGITGNLARVLSELMSLFKLEERDIVYLSNKYKLSTLDDGEEKESDKEKHTENEKNSDDEKYKTYAYCFAAVVKADGNVSNEERRRVGEYLTANFSNPSVAIAYFNRLVNGRSTPSLSIPKEFILITSYHERYAFIETLLSFTLLNLENNENGSNNNGSGVVLKLMKLFELQESDIQYLCNKFHIREPKQKKSKESDKRYTEYKNKDQRANSGRKSKQYQQGSQYNNQQQQEQQQQESRVERRQKKLEYAYAVLGLSSSATPDEIRKAYRSLALKYHPDTVQEDFLKLELTEKFKEINWAYNLLRQEFSF